MCKYFPSLTHYKIYSTFQSYSEYLTHSSPASCNKFKPVLQFIKVNKVYFESLIQLLGPFDTLQLQLSINWSHQFSSTPKIFHVFQIFKALFKDSTMHIWRQLFNSQPSEPASAICKSRHWLLSLSLFQAFQRERRALLHSPPDRSTPCTCCSRVSSTILVPAPTAALPPSVHLWTWPCPPSCQLPAPASVCDWTTSAQPSLGYSWFPATSCPSSTLPLSAPPL